MKTVYLVRHGESEENVGETYMGGAARLTEHGKEQAAFIAERVSKLPVEVIIASTMTRARETGDIIAARVGKPIEYSDLFVERGHPSSHIGMLRKSPEFLKDQEDLLERLHEPGPRIEGRENFDDFYQRSGKALQLLDERPEENILVVSHGIFLSVLLARVVMGDKLNAFECNRFIRTFYMRNTGITILRDNPEDRWPLKWQVRVWNDHSHLAD